MATPTRAAEPSIPKDAPVSATARSEIDAPADRVWGVLTAIDDWPSWNPDVESAALDGPLAPGSTFRWKAGPARITSTIEQVDRPQLIAWTGKTLGIRAVHIWRLEQHDGRTSVETEESYEGLVARLLRRSLQKTLDKALTNGVRHLKSASERLTAAGDAQPPGEAEGSLPTRERP